MNDTTKERPAIGIHVVERSPHCYESLPLLRSTIQVELERISAQLVHYGGTAPSGNLARPWLTDDMRFSEVLSSLWSQDSYHEIFVFCNHPAERASDHLVISRLDARVRNV